MNAEGNAIEIMKNNMLFKCDLQAKEGKKCKNHLSTISIYVFRVLNGYSRRFLKMISVGRTDIEVRDEGSKMIEISESDLRFKCQVSAHPIKDNDNFLRGLEDLDEERRGQVLEVMQSNMLFKCSLSANNPSSRDD